MSSSPELTLLIRHLGFLPIPRLMFEAISRKVDLNLLVVFAVVMQENSTTNAGKRLNLSQSAVSQGLRRLKAAVNDPLFVRDRNKFVPTSRAQSLYLAVAPSLSGLVRALDEDGGFNPATSDRTFHMCVTTIQGAALTPSLLAKLSGLAPGVRLAVEVGHADATGGRQLDESRFDVLIASSFLKIEDCHRRYDFEPVPIVCVYDGKRLGIEPPISVDRYAALPHVVPTPGLYARTSVVEADLQAAGIKRDQRMVTNDLSGLPIYLKNLDAIANVPTPAAYAFQRLYDLTVSPIPASTVRPYQDALYWHSRKEKDPAHKWLRAMIIEAMNELGRSGA